MHITSHQHTFRGTPGTLIVCPHEDALLKATRADGGGGGSSDDDDDDDKSYFECPGCSMSFSVSAFSFQDISLMAFPCWEQCWRCGVPWKVRKTSEEEEEEGTKPANAFKCPKCSCGAMVNKADDEDTADKEARFAVQ